MSNAQGKPPGAPSTAVSPSWTWGSSATLRVDENTPLDPSGSGVAVSAQLAQVSLPEPAVVSLYFQATFRTTQPFDEVRTYVLNLNTGVGRVTVPRQIVFQAQPALNAPIEFTIPFLPIHALNVDVQAYIQTENNPGQYAEIETYLQITPLTRIPQKEQALAFGMALPGEADDLDDEMREELEAEGPSVQQAMMQTLNGPDASDGRAAPDDDDDDDDDDAPELTPAQRVAQALAQRLGRRPTRIEVQLAVRRIRERQQRRRGR